MDRLRRRERMVFSGFTDAEIEKLESLYAEYGELSVNRDFCQKIAKGFNRSAGRAGKPILKWAEVQSWFQKRLQFRPVSATPPSKNEKEINLSHNLAARPDASDPKKANESNQVHKEGEKARDLSELEFEARSARDGAWYDVERFLSHRFASSGEVEVHVRFVGFGSEEDEWVNVRGDVRERSIPLENWDCQKIKVGDVMLCLQERKDQAIYYDVQISEINRKMHDIRGCRCIFTVQYIHDKSEASTKFVSLILPIWFIFLQNIMDPEVHFRSYFSNRKVFVCGDCVAYYDTTGVYDLSMYPFLLNGLQQS